ncbi:MAG TPA: hypothetical protein VHP36_04585 [Chitinispirillaceae bacterium]|nr:hypothetical protein [Chitinispirillaceae bacterium]
MFISFSLFLICCIAPTVSLAENDSEVINDLYQEIMSASAIRTDTGHSSAKTNNVLKSEKDSLSSASFIQDDLSDLKTDKLHKEIEKIRNDIEARHSATIKFMQDDK